MFVGAGLSAREALLTIDCDLLTLLCQSLWCLRCSCCSRLTKRVLLLPPLALVATLNAASWFKIITYPVSMHADSVAPSRLVKHELCRTIADGPAENSEQVACSESV
ncbi:hypothetical protein PF010_g9115 [Phytophthora fragariae]|nr:hypothetical protein PF009_g10845 [Phytophthora fragariae]KAE9115989.1 hypothetical protein PF010_g9115 [Phytophthora fragariae]